MIAMQADANGKAKGEPFLAVDLVAQGKANL